MDITWGQCLPYYHQATFSKLTTFSKFLPATSILKIFPYFKLWYFYSCCSWHMHDFFDILYVKTIVYDTEHWLQNAWLCILLNVLSFPGHSCIPKFYDILECSIICQIPSFRISRDNPHEHQEIQVLACQSVTFLMHFQSPCCSVTFCDIFGKGGVKINVRHLPWALGQIIPPKKP